MCYSNDSEKQVFQYQKTGNSETLIDVYKNFLLKYYRVFANEHVDFANYDLRYFISCYMKDVTERRSLRRGKFRSNETKAKAYRIIHNLRKAFSKHQTNKDVLKDEIFCELLIPFSAG